MRLIDADELIEQFNSIEDAEHCKLTINGVVNEIVEMPTMRVVPVEALEKIRSEISKLPLVWGHGTAVKDCLNIVNRVIEEYSECKRSEKK